MTIVLAYALYNFMFDDARIGHKNTYDMLDALLSRAYYNSTTIVYANTHDMRAKIVKKHRTNAASSTPGAPQTPRLWPII